MNCRRVQQLLPDTLEGCLNERDARLAAAHLRDCRSCRRLRDALATFESNVRETSAWPPAPRRNPRRQAIDRWIAEQKALPGWRRGLRTPGPTAVSPAARAATAAAVAVAVLGAVLVGRGPSLHKRSSVLPVGAPALTRRSVSLMGPAPPADIQDHHAGIVSLPVLGGRLSAPTRGTVEAHPSIAESGPAATTSRAPGARHGHGGDDFVQIPFPRLVSRSDRQLATALASYEREAAVVDARLAREVSVEQKGTALADLCDRLRADTDIRLTAGQSVADEKVTLFCRKQPLRDVMWQLSRPFGYTWLRSGLPSPRGGGGHRPAEGGVVWRGYRYELVQDLRSQLLEEELRNRDRNEALLALDRDIQRYRPYLGLSPDEAQARGKTASPEEKRLLDQLARTGWGPMQMYSRLSAQDLPSLRAGQALTFSQEPKPGERPLPPDLARGVLECNRGWRLVKSEEGFGLTPDLSDPRSVPLTADPEARAKVALWISQSELGVFTLDGVSGAFPVNSNRWGTMDGTGTPLAVGMSPTVLKPDNAGANAKLARDPALRPRVTVPLARPGARVALREPAAAEGGERTAESGAQSEPRVTSADALEALHRATGVPIVSDYYTRLYKPAALAVRNMPLFDALNHLADATRSRWSKEGSWVQLRSTSFYDDRLKEVPNRHLARWAVSRQEHGALTLEDLAEIVQLTDAQLNAEAMAEGARALWGLTEWDLARSPTQRPHLRYLAQFTPAQRQEALSPAGLPFATMSLAQQQRYLSLAFLPESAPLQALDELEGAVLRVEYILPGGFEWRIPGPDALAWVVPMERGRQGRRALRPPVREKTREAAVEAARRFDPRLRDAIVEVVKRVDPRLEASFRPDEPEITPTRLSLTIIYIPGLTNNRPIHVLRARQDLTTGTGW